MIKHMILWQIKDELQGKERAEAALQAKNALEALQGKIEGLVSVRVEISPLPSSNADMMLEAVLTDADALARYQKHPAHLAAANGSVRPIAKARSCFDFEC